MALLLIIGATWLSAIRADRYLRADLLQRARIASAALNPRQAAALKGDATDLTSPDYQQIKEQLARIRQSYPSCRFLYLMSLRSDGTIVINVDSEPVHSKDYSPPGQIYNEASDELRRVFTTGAALVEGPADDRWGTWISPFIPLPDPETGKVERVFGMDIDAAEWKWIVASRAAFPAVLIAITVLLGLLAILLHRSRLNIHAREEELRKSEEALRCIFKAAPVGLCIVKDHIIQSVNNAWCNNFGYSESEVIGKTSLMIYETEAECERVRNELDSSLHQRGIVSVQTRHVRKDGAIRDVIVTVALLQSETDSSEVVVVTEDVTDLIEKEKALKESHKRLEDIIDFLPDATLAIDRDGRVITWNRAIEVLTGIKKHDMIGRCDYEYAIPFYGHRRPILVDLALHPDQKIEKYYTVIQRKGDLVSGESFVPNVPPGDVHISGTATVFRDDQGKIVAAIECIRDNTQRRKLEERLKQAEKMETLGTLAGGVAHDLNNVLGVMVGYSELLQDMMPEGSPQKKYAAHIFNSSVKGAAIIQDLLTLARRGIHVFETVNLNEVIFDYLKSPVFEKLQSFHPEVKILTDLEEGLLNMKGSSVHLGKMMMNLVSNAAESISGRGEVMIRTENRYLDKPIQGQEDMKEGDYIVLTVTDSGSGIPAHETEKIFEPFYSRKVLGRSGTGLGLTIVWGTVRDHDGYIDVQSEEGIGSRFTLYFPATGEKPVSVEDTVSPVLYMGNGESILIVDDVREQRELAQRELAMNMLEKLGYKVEAVAGGEAAIEYLRYKKADLVVLDMILGSGIDGMETYRRILEIAPGQKAVIVSGFSENDRVRAAQKMGAGTFVRKPYIMEKIGLAVRQELDRK